MSLLMRLALRLFTLKCFLAKGRPSASLEVTFREGSEGDHGVRTLLQARHSLQAKLTAAAVGSTVPLTPEEHFWHHLSVYPSTRVTSVAGHRVTLAYCPYVANIPSDAELEQQGFSLFYNFGACLAPNVQKCAPAGVTAGKFRVRLSVAQ